MSVIRVSITSVDRTFSIKSNHPLVLIQYLVLIISSLWWMCTLFTIDTLINTSPRSSSCIWFLFCDQGLCFNRWTDWFSWFVIWSEWSKLWPTSPNLIDLLLLLGCQFWSIGHSLFTIWMVCAHWFFPHCLPSCSLTAHFRPDYDNCFNYFAYPLSFECLLN